MEIFIFKTNIQPQDLPLIKTLLTKVTTIERWSTDLEDCDNILRIVSTNNILDTVIELVSKHGFQIDELED